MANQLTYLFGGDQPWNESLWTASDDRVRGGSSISHLTVLTPTQALFHGNLDTKTLGGAGFASQRTTGDLSLDLTNTAGLQLELGADNSEHKFTLTVKDAIPGRSDDGRDQAGLSWEVNFEAPKDGGVIVKKWEDFRATYRGRDVEDAKPLDLGDVKRVSLMMRSFFDQQDGDFKLVVNSIAALKKDCNGDDSDDDGDLRKPTDVVPREETSRPLWKRLFCGLL
ncbi:complex i intermediate-associated 30 [Fusarium albosuccineum]|uniref:Complex i intermediate-associated 30 n=1 Tax=Fusarium albosuccineum TaxID=1237068 RepID=A0A8H4L651_9HYPO|nr:complex i intermediate-associated 30 [Fusarium albosuccineum]